MLVVEAQPVERLTLARNLLSQEILIKNIKRLKKRQQEIVVFQLVVVREEENYHQLQQQKEHLPKAEHVQQVEVLVAEKQEVNPLNLSIFSPTVCLEFSESYLSTFG